MGSSPSQNRLQSSYESPPTDFTPPPEPLIIAGDNHADHLARKRIDNSWVCFVFTKYSILILRCLISFHSRHLIEFIMEDEFKPASIDKNQSGKLHKTNDNKVAVEFQNNQPGKPKVSFEGSSEDYKDNDAVLIFDGTSFRLERLHRSVKRLRHVRQPGESAAATSLPGPQLPESSSPPLGKGPKLHSSNKSVLPTALHEGRYEDQCRSNLTGTR